MNCNKLAKHYCVFKWVMKCQQRGGEIINICVMIPSPFNGIKRLGTIWSNCNFNFFSLAEEDNECDACRGPETLEGIVDNKCRADFGKWEHLRLS